MHGDYGYFEVQVHGGVSVGDIARVEYAVALDEETLTLLDDTGIEHAEYRQLDSGEVFPLLPRELVVAVLAASSGRESAIHGPAH